MAEIKECFVECNKLAGEKFTPLEIRSEKRRSRW